MYINNKTLLFSLCFFMPRSKRLRKVKINRPPKHSLKQLQGLPLVFINRTGKHSFKGFRTY